MTTQAKHSAATRDYASEAKEYETLSERLDAAERLLNDRAWSLRSTKNPLFIDLDVTDEEYDLYLSLLRDVLSTEQFIPKNVENLYNRVPLVFFASLVHHALTSTTTDFWPSYLSSLSVGASDVLRDIIQSDLEPLLKRKALASFSRTQLSKRYVDKIRLHAGIPAGELRPLLERIQYDMSADPSLRNADADDYAGFLVKELRGAKGNTSRLQCVRTMSLALPDKIGNLIARLFELTQHSVTEKSLPAVEEFEGTFGLPEPLFKQAHSFLSGTEDVRDTAQSTNSDAELAGPRLFLDPETCELKLVFASVQAKEANELEPTWTIVIDGARHSVRQERDWSTGGWSELEYVLDRPYRELTVIGPRNNVYPMDAASLAKRDYLLFRPDGFLYSHQSSLSKSGALIVLPAAAHTELSSGGRLSRLGQIPGWKRWIVKALTGGKKGHLTIDVGNRRVSLEVKVAREAVFDSAEAVIPHLLGSDRRPVYRESPRIRIPSGKDSWTLRYYLLRKDQRTLLDEYKVESELKGTTFDVFDAADDPWVGRYEVQVFRNNELQSVNTFNLAEGLNLSLSYKNWVERGQFRSPDPHAKRFCLTTATASFNEPSGSRLTISKPVVRISSELTSAAVRVSSKFDREQYYLDVYACPPTMTYSFPERDSNSKRYIEPKAFSFNDIDDIGEFVLQFPKKVYEPKISLVPISKNGNRSSEITTLPLIDNRANTWTINISRLKSEMKKSTTYVIAVQWKSNSYEEWVKAHVDRINLSKLKKRAYEDKRPFAASTLAKITKDPLLKSALVNDHHLELKWGREVRNDIDIRVWNISNPLAPAVSLIASGNSVQLPEDICDGSTLIVEAKEREFLSTWNPARPSAKAVVVEGLSPLFNPLAKQRGNRWLFEPVQNSQLMGSEIRTLWQIRDCFHAVLDSRPMSDIDGLGALAHTTSTYLQRSPRVSVNTLSESPIDDAQQLSAFIRADLANKSLQVRATAGEIHPIPWVGLLQEMSDVRVLKSYLRSLVEPDELAAEELSESLTYIQETGGEFVFKTMQGIETPFTLIERGFINDEILRLFRTNGVNAVLNVLPPLGSHKYAITSTENYSDALIQLMNNTVRLKQIEGLYPAWEWLRKREHLLSHFKNLDVLKSVNTLADLSMSHRKSAEDNWMYAPYVSFMCALFARAEANGLLHAFNDHDDARNTWSSVAEVAPKLAAIDIVLAEAFALGATKHVLVR